MERRFAIDERQRRKHRGERRAVTVAHLIDVGRRSDRNKLVAAWPEAFKGTDLDPETNRARKEKLLARVQALAARAEAAAPDATALSGAELAERLKEALASNTMGGKADAEARRKADTEEVESVREAWRRLGPVPGEAGALLEASFERACAPFASRAPRARVAAPRVGAGIA